MCVQQALLWFYLRYDHFYRRIRLHKFRLEKAEEDKELVDKFYLHEKFPNHWGILADHEMTRCLIPYKKPAKEVLFAEKGRVNKKLSSDRIIVENYFGRMMMLWNIMADKYKWSEQLYDTVAMMCISLTNVHVRNQPLRLNDGEWYGRYLNRLARIGADKKRKRAETQALSRKNRRQRLRVRFRSVTGLDDDTQSD